MDLLRSTISQSFAVFVELNWQVTILALVIGLAAFLSRKTSSHFRYWLWCILLVRLCIPFSLSLPYGLGDDLRALLTSIPDWFTREESTQTAPDAGDPVFFQSPPATIPVPVQIQENIPEVAIPAEPVVIPAPPLTWQEIVMVCWAGMVMLLAGMIGWWLRRVSRILRQAQPVERLELHALLQKLHKNLGIRRPVRMRCLDERDFFGPAVVGLLRPTIYLPRHIAEQWPVEDIEPILLHELVHVQRGDLLVNWLQILAQAAWFFHPLVWLANNRIRTLREDICDDVAIRNLDTNRARYTGNMLQVVKAMNHTPAGSLLMLGFTETQKSLTRRIMRIMSTTYRNHPRLTKVSAALLVAVMAVGLVLTASQSEEMKSAADFEQSNYGTALSFYPEGMTWDEIVAVVKEEGKPGMLYFSSECGCCIAMEEQVFSDKVYAGYIDSNYVPVWIESQRGVGADLSKRFGIIGTPVIVLIDEQGELLGKWMGYGNSKNFLEHLESATSGVLRALRTAWQNDPDDQTAALFYADELFKSDEWASAIPIYENLLEKPLEDTTVVRVYMYLAECYYLTYDKERWLEWLDAGIRTGALGPAKDIVQCRLAIWLFKQKEYTKAFEYYKQLPKSADDFPTFSSWGGDKRYIKSKFDQVQSYLPILHMKTGHESIGREMLDHQYAEYSKEKDTHDFGQLLNMCVEHDVYLKESLPWAAQLNERTEWKSSFNLGNYIELLQKIGDYDKAIEMCDKLRKVIGDEEFNKIYQRKLIVAHYQASHTELAKTLEQKLADAIGKDAYLAWSTANEFKKYNLYTQALPWSQRAAEYSALEYRPYNSMAMMFDLFPGMALRDYAEVLFETGEIEKAIEVQIRALALFRTEDDRRESRKCLEKYRAALNSPSKTEGSDEATVPPAAQGDSVRIQSPKDFFEQLTLREAARYHNDGQYEKAVAEYEKKLPSIMNDVVTSQTLGFSQDLKNRFLFSGYLFLSHSYVKTGQEKKGRDAILFAVKYFDFDDTYTKLYLAAEHCYRSNYFMDLAFQWAQEICEMSDWKRVGSLTLYAMIAEKRGDHKTAIETEKRILHHQTGSPYADSKGDSDFYTQLAIARLTIASGDSTAGEQMYEVLIDSSEGNAKRLISVGTSILSRSHFVRLSKPPTTLNDMIEWAGNSSSGEKAPYQQARYLGLLAALLLEKGDKQEAVATLERALKLSPSNAFLLRRLEKYRSALSSPSKTEGQSQAFEPQVPQNTLKLTPQSFASEQEFNQARQYHRNGAFRLAIRRYESYLEHYPAADSATVAAYYLADCHWRLQKNEEAIHWYSNFLDQNPDDAHVKVATERLQKLQKGFGFQAVQVRDSTLLQLRKSWQDDPYDQGSAVQYAYAEIAHGDYTLAWAILDPIQNTEYFKSPATAAEYVRIVASIPEQGYEPAPVRNLKGWLPVAFYHSGQAEAGLAELNRQLDQHFAYNIKMPMWNDQTRKSFGHMSALSLLSTCMMNNVYVHESAPWIEKLVRLTKQEMQAADSYTYQQAKGMANRAFRSALELQADHQILTGQYSAAIATLGNASEVADSMILRTDIREKVACLKLLIGETAKAEQVFSQLYNDGKSDWRALYQLAHICHKLKVKQMDAAGWAREAAGMTEYNEQRVECLQLSATLLFAAGNVAGAIAAQEEAVRLIPENPRLKENLQKYRSAVPVPVKSNGQAQTPALQRESRIPVPHEDREEPLTKLEAAYQANPADRDNTLAYAERLSRIGRNKEALPIFQKLFAEETDSARKAQLYGWIGRTYFSTNQYLQAIALWKEALASGILPDYKEVDDVMSAAAIAPHSTVEALELLAYFSQHTHNDADYIDYCSRIPNNVVHDPRYFNITTGLPYAHDRLGHTGRGREELLRLVKVYGNAPNSTYSYLLRLAQECLESGVYIPDILAAVRRAYEYKVENNDRSPHIAMIYAELLLRNGQTQQARTILESEVAADTGANRTPLYMNHTMLKLKVVLSIVNEIADQHQPGVKTLDDWVKERQSDFSTLSAVFQSCRELHVRSEQWLPWAARLVELAEKDGVKAGYISRYASLLFEHGDTQQAIALVKDAVAKYPYSYQLHLDLERYRAARN